jgi:hypothetical protein
MNASILDCRLTATILMMMMILFEKTSLTTTFIMLCALLNVHDDLFWNPILECVVMKQSLFYAQHEEQRESLSLSLSIPPPPQFASSRLAQKAAAAAVLASRRRRRVCARARALSSLSFLSPQTSLQKSSHNLGSQIQDIF